MQTLYNPLDSTKREIRLFSLCASSDTESIVELRLYQTTLAQVKRDGFIPFSYVWGDPAETASIVLNSKTLQVGRNLADMLKYARNHLLPSLRLKESSESALLFWADALCVNQSDVEERNQQVALMRDIFGSAELAVAWQGVYDDADLATELLNAIYSDWFLALEAAHGTTFRSRDMNDMLELETNFRGWMEKYPQFWRRDCEGLIGNKYFVTLANLLWSPYWDRVWTYQEVILPKRVIVMAGSSMFEYPVLLALFKWAKNVSNRRHDPLTIVDQCIWTSVASCCHLKLHPFALIQYSMVTKLRGQQDVIRLAAHCDLLQATDPRDHVFGILALMNTSIKADYTVSVSETFREYVETWWTELRDTNFLQWAGLNIQPPDSALPTWIPDWAYISQSVRPLIGSFDRVAGRFCAGGHLTCDEVVFSSRSGTLSVPGVLVDQIDIVSDIFPTSSIPLLDKLAEWTTEQFSAGRTILPGCNMHIIQALFRTAFLDKQHNTHKNPLSDLNSEETHSLAIAFLILLMWPKAREEGRGEHEARLLEKWFPLLGLAAGETFASHYRDTVFPEAREIPQLKHWTSAAEALRYENQRKIASMTFLNVNKNLADRVLFITKKGYLGVVPRAKIGDHIAVIAKCDVPALLRDKEELRMVGTCFVLGLMHGEANADDTHILRIH